MSALVFSLGACAAPEGPSGPVSVVDGDTIDVGGTRIRLHAIDAPERTQTCADAAGARFDCGAWSAAQVTARFGGREATCAPRDTDRYGRMVARCAVDGVDMGAEIVARGWAFSYARYGRDYVADEAAAAAAGLGLHGVDVTSPEAFRRAGHADGTPPRSGCAIKGNISRSGRIYHLPGQTYYDRTGIDPAQGERWFCSEAEAQAAGWRRAAL